MAGLDPAIHAVPRHPAVEFIVKAGGHGTPWIAGSSPAMTLL